ncbi:MAG: hypothetical protein PHH91_02655 [Desulfuromonadaceae bacterium]|nr:hypothetical protein [Desulfuromonadaceae bacterium]
MNFARVYNYTIAALLIVIYLTLPAVNLAGAATPGVGLFPAEAACSTALMAPCSDCPCSGDESSGCCDKVFCNCACHAPLSRSPRLTYAPVMAIQIFLEPYWSLPQVYRPIFVPPQNHA